MSRGRGSSGALARTFAVLLAVVSCALPLASHAGTEYRYDDLGRLVEAINSDGTVTIYRYDAGSNIISIERLASGTLSIAHISPTLGHAGTIVAISGNGFSTTLNDNAVTIAGAAATVSSASPTTLTAAIPAAAASVGPVSVTVNGVTAVGTQQVTVLRPAITGFSPSVVLAGATIAVTGTNLNLVFGSTTVTVGSTPATVTSVTNTSVVFAAPAAGSIGPVHVITPYGEAVSSANLIVAPSVATPASVTSSAVLIADGGGASLNVVQASQKGLFAFSATAGQYLSLQLGAFFASGGSAGYTLYDAFGATLKFGTVGTQNRTILLPVIPATGVYFIVFASTANLQTTATLEIDAQTSIGAPSLTVAGAAAQTKRVVFTATAGQNIGVGLRNLTLNPSNQFVQLTVYEPDNTSLSSVSCYQANGGCTLALRNVPSTGIYTIITGPAGGASTSFRLTLSEPVTGSVDVGSSQSVSIPTEGQFGIYTFTATAGQTVAIGVNTISTTPANRKIFLDVYGPTGTRITGSSGYLWFTLNLQDLAAGTYTMVAVPEYGVPADFQLIVATGLTGALPVDATTTTFPTGLPGQEAYLTFNATAGDNIGIGIRNLIVTPNSNYVAFILYAPNGSQLKWAACYQQQGGCGYSAVNLPQTGAYRIVLDPGGSTMSFRITLSAAVTGTIPLDTPQNVSYIEGQFGWYTFTVMAGQTLAVNAKSIVSTPAGRGMYFSVRDPSGAIIASSTSSSQMTFNLKNLAPGTYRIGAVPEYGVAETAQITVASGLAGQLPVDGTSSTYTSTVGGQGAYFTFNATAGDNVGIGVRGLSITPSSQWTSFVVYAPSGTQLNWSACYQTTSGCAYALTNLPQTGTYRVVLEPQGGAVFSFHITLSVPLTTPITLGTPQNVTLREGQFVWAPFTLPATQNVSVTVSSYVTSPTGGGRTISVKNSGGTSVGSTTGTTLNLTDLAAGTYTLSIVPTNGVSATMVVNVQ
jgi:YD repeat-containing protein